MCYRKEAFGRLKESFGTPSGSVSRFPTLDLSSNDKGIINLAVLKSLPMWLQALASICGAIVWPEGHHLSEGILMKDSRVKLRISLGIT